MFEATPQFVAFIDHVLRELTQLRKQKKNARVVLVINGDFVDFLAEPDAAVFNLRRSAGMLEDIFERPEFRGVLEALQKYVRADGTHLALTLGNHDLELALPSTRRVLVQLLTGGDAALEGKVELSFDGWGYRFQVGGRRALCLHGNESDTFNFTRYDELDRVIQDVHLFGHSAFGADWVPSAGSWFVINAINPIKRELPFVDLLKPEIPLTATVLGVLDPRKVKYVDEAAMLMAKMAINESTRPASQRRMLSVAAADAKTPAAGQARRTGLGLTEEEIEQQAERALADDKIDDLIHLPVDAEMLGWKEWTAPLRDAVRWMKDKAVNLTDQVNAALTDAAETAHMTALRMAIRTKVTDDPYDVGALDIADERINHGVRANYAVVFAGHTHFRRIAIRPNDVGLYVNTGTWAGLMSLTRAQVDGWDFWKVYKALRAGTRQALRDAKLIRQECTVARMSVEGVRKVVVALGGVEKRHDGKDPVKFPPETALVV
jgi:UDP-2,3-diacylglucosamine pyrophosphatase LpxH